uniref:Uncharacterized protein n=1 Tax=Tanacetum cinerariifolium TaxID=118510 RepID=A0A699I9C7_TANCI|nr:hypothetical protein [Tanacetum cinerariifolium]
MWGFKECSSCEALYNKSCACSKGGFIAKFVRDPNKTPDSSQRSSQDCSKCGNPVDGLYCRHCALLRKKLKEDPGENSSQSPPHIDHQCGYGCGDSLDGIFCQRCTYKSCGKGAHYGYNYPPKIPICYDDDDDKESSTPLRDIIIFELPLCIAITPILSTKEPKETLIIGDAHLDTIPKKESDEFIKSSVENLVPNLCESEDEHECDVPVYDDFTTFSNLLFDADDDFSSSDDKSFSDKDIPKDIYSNPLFDEEIISIKIDPHHFNIDSLLDEFAGELIFLKLIPSGIDEPDYDPEEEIRLIEKFLYDNLSPRPPEEFDYENSNVVIESFSPSPIPVEDSDPFLEKINLFLTSDGSIPPGIDSDYSNSERHNLFLERLLHDDPIPLPATLDF